MSSRLFWRAAAVQAVLVGALFAVLAIALPHSFFEHWGIVVGPIAWIACAAAAAAILRVPLLLAALSAAAGGVAGAVVGLAATHLISLPVAIGVFAASCAGYQSSTPASRSHAATGSGTSSP
ncbi:MAG: hypothetical protein ACJ77M_01980 [Thermoleophilaceae bacterium]